MAIRQHFRRPTHPNHVPHIEQLALHAAVIALALTVALIKIAG